MVDGERFFEWLAGKKVAEFLAGIRHAGRAKEMALFANAIARSGSKLGGIHDGAGSRVAEMPRDGTVATRAGDRFGRKSGSAIFVQRARDGERGAGVAEHAGFVHGPREIGIRNAFVAGSQVVGVTKTVEGHRRLKEMASDVREVAGGMCAGADDVADAIVDALRAVFPPLCRAVGGGVHGDF